MAELSRNLSSSLVLRESILRFVNLQEHLHELELKSGGMQVRYQPSFIIPVVEDTLIYTKVTGQGMLLYFNLNNVKVILITGCLTLNLLLKIFCPKKNPNSSFSFTSKILLCCNLPLGQTKAMLT